MGDVYWREKIRQVCGQLAARGVVVQLSAGTFALWSLGCRMTATSTLIEALRRSKNDIDEAFAILRRSSWPEAHSATRIL